MNKRLQTTRTQLAPSNPAPTKGAERPPSDSKEDQKAGAVPATTAGPIPALVVFGTDPSGKPRAAYFEESQADLAAKAAGQLQLQLVRITTEDERGHRQLDRLWSR